MTCLFSTVALLLAFAYAALMLLYRYGWRKLPEWKVSDGYVPSLMVTVLIPARNEAPNIDGCVRSVLEGSYPPDLLELIVVDDHSTDDTAERVKKIQSELAQKGRPGLLRLLQLSELGGEGKKTALAQAVRHAKGAIILTTDADCVVGHHWVSHVVAGFDQTGGTPMLTLSPVLFHREQNLLQRFQALDFVGLMGITGAGIGLGFQRMGNGANLAYRKSVFDAVEGYTGNAQIASGDDLFLVQKVEKQFPGSVYFLKSRKTVVWTEAEPDWRGFWRQRVRWGAKNLALPEWPMRLVLLSVFLFCWSILLNALLSLVLVLVFPGALLWSCLLLLLFQLVVKSFFDWFFLRDICRFFDRMDLLRWFWPSFVLHTVYVALVGLAGLWHKEYTWKGRRTR